MQENDIQTAVLDILKNNLKKDFKLFLFGSRATNKNSPYSDFDFLIDATCAIDDDLFRKIKDQISELPTLYSIDLTDYHNCNPDFLNSIKKDLKVVKDE